MGWQLAGDKPSIDSLFYMGFYGGHGTQWSPQFTTSMKVGSVCWAPVVDGYSGIDPDSGRIVVDTSYLDNTVLLDDQQENRENSAADEINDKVRGLIGQTRLELRLAAYSTEADIAFYLNNASLNLNNLLAAVNKSNGTYLPENTEAYLQQAFSDINSIRTLYPNDVITMMLVDSYEEGLSNIASELSLISK